MSCFTVTQEYIEFLFLFLYIELHVASRLNLVTMIQKKHMTQNDTIKHMTQNDTIKHYTRNRLTPLSQKIQK